jgi:hypothetical protein
MCVCLVPGGETRGQINGRNYSTKEREAACGKRRLKHDGETRLKRGKGTDDTTGCGREREKATHELKSAITNEKEESKRGGTKRDEWKGGQVGGSKGVRERAKP